MSGFSGSCVLLLANVLANGFMRTHAFRVTVGGGKGGDWVLLRGDEMQRRKGKREGGRSQT